MRSGKPSGTAQFGALNRALGTLARVPPGFGDPFAEQFLPASWGRKVERALRRRVAAHAGLSPYPFRLRGMGLFQQFRTVVLDRAIAAACR